MIALPKHEPCGLDGAGELIAGGCAARCEYVVTFANGRQKKAIGCGAVSKVCGRCGLRAMWNDGPCGACERRES